MDAPDTTKPTGLRDQALLEVIYGAGLRVSEASNLRVTDLNLSTREVRVKGKGSKERVVLVGQVAKSALSLYLRDARPKLAGKSSGMTLFLNRFRRSSQPAQHPREGAPLQCQGRVALRRAYAHAAALIRHPFAGGRRGPARGSGVIGSRQSRYHTDIHACHQFVQARAGLYGRLTLAPNPLLQMALKPTMNAQVEEEADPSIIWASGLLTYGSCRSASVLPKSRLLM